jgi:hypothetical protein
MPSELLFSAPRSSCCQQAFLIHPLSPSESALLSLSFLIPPFLFLPLHHSLFSISPPSLLFSCLFLVFLLFKTYFFLLLTFQLLHLRLLFSFLACSSCSSCSRRTSSSFSRFNFSTFAFSCFRSFSISFLISCSFS